MRLLRKAARRLLSATQRQRVWVGVVTTRETLTGAVGAIFRLAPTALAVALKEGIRPRRRLDYAGQRVLMEVGSFAQWDRLGACTKEPETVRWLELTLRPGDVLYDIGANVGAYALVAHAVLRGTGRIYAFEPSFASHAALCQNILLNRGQDSIIPLPVALAAETSLARLHYSSTAPGAALHSLRAGAGEARGLSPALAVPCYRLDELTRLLGLAPPTHIKLDVDGGELDVLRGAAATLAGPQLRALLVEVEDDPRQIQALSRWLEPHGFRATSSHAHPGPGRAVNHIFERPRP